MNKFTVTKASGAIEDFQENKIYSSIKRARVPAHFQQDLVEKVKRKLTPQIATKQIQKIITNELKKTNYPEGRYNLKSAIMKLGPTGFPFEKYIANILRVYGYNTKTNLILAGRCVHHEVDISAHKDDKHILVECKYHNQLGNKSDIKVALYAFARYDDLVSAQNHRSRFHQGWLVTNTKCTTDAIHYANCVGLKITAWSYPAEECLQKIIEDKKLYPITCLSSLVDSEISVLLSKDIVTINEIGQSDYFGKILNIPQSRVVKIQKEANTLLE